MKFIIRSIEDWEKYSDISGYGHIYYIASEDLSKEICEWQYKRNAELLAQYETTHDFI